MMLRIASQEAEEEDGLWNMDELWWCVVGEQAQGVLKKGGLGLGRCAP